VGANSRGLFPVGQRFFRGDNCRSSARLRRWGGKRVGVAGLRYEPFHWVRNRQHDRFALDHRGVVFYRYARADDPEVLTKRATRWLLRGSILELLVAVPSHIGRAPPQRLLRADRDALGDCHRNFHHAVVVRTGVFFLFVERCRRLQPPNAHQRNRTPTGQIPVKQCKGFKNRGEPTADPGIDRSSSLTPSARAVLYRYD